MRQTTRITAYGLVRRENRVLLVRASAQSAVPGTWFFPGGGVEFAEAAPDCVVRDLYEETGLVAGKVRLRNVISDVAEYQARDETIHAVRVLYDVEHVDGELHVETDGSSDEVGWFDVPQALSLPLMPFVRTLLTDG